MIIKTMKEIACDFFVYEKLYMVKELVNFSTILFFHIYLLKNSCSNFCMWLFP